MIIHYRLTVFFVQSELWLAPVSCQSPWVCHWCSVCLTWWRRYSLWTGLHFLFLHHTVIRAEVRGQNPLVRPIGRSPPTASSPPHHPAPLEPPPSQHSRWKQTGHDLNDSSWSAVSGSLLWFNVLMSPQEESWTTFMMPLRRAANPTDSIKS